MTTLADRPNTAVLVIDLQNEVVANAYRRHEVLNAVNMLIERTRTASVPVIWVRHADDELKAGSEAWQIVAELAPAPGEVIVEKSYRDAFEGTDLEQCYRRSALANSLWPARRRTCVFARRCMVRWCAAMTRFWSAMHIRQKTGRIGARRHPML